MSGRLYRSRTDRMVSGVAGGVAEYLGLDPSLVRVVWAVLMFVTGGLFFLVYVVMWIVVPEGAGGVRAAWHAAPPGEAADPAAGPAADRSPTWSASTDWGGGNGRLILGLVLIAVGAYFLLRNYLPDIAWNRLWPVLLVLAGAALLIASMRRDRR